MSLDTKNQKCAVCSAYLFEEDDIVYCPVCGAPHHRDCYSAIGKCGLEEFHGTDKQYRREEPASEPPVNDAPPKSNPFPKNCRSCGMPLDENSHFCGNCGRPSSMNSAPFGASPFDAPPIDPKTPICDGVSAGDAAKVVRTNNFRYIPKFLKLGKEHKSSWNWAAFLLPHGWFAYRKMYKESIITTVLMIATVLMNIPFALALAQQPSPDSSMTNILQLGQYYSQYLGEIGLLPLLLSLAGSALTLAVRIISAIYGDYIYKQRVILSVSLIRKAEDTEAAKTKYSGTSFIGFLLAILATEFIPSIISLFL